MSKRTRKRPGAKRRAAPIGIGTDSRPPLEPLYTIPEISKASKRSRASIYRDIAAKRLEITKVNGATRVTAPQYRRYIGIDVGSAMGTAA
jgi:hypothetical protein